VGLAVGAATVVGLAAHAVVTNVRKGKTVRDDIKSARSDDKKGGA